MNMSINTTTCPTCLRTAKPRIKIHEYPDLDRIVVTEHCGYCRMELAQRVSTNEIESVRRDILRLERRVQGGEAFMEDVLIARRNRYNMLTANLKRNENN
jgi:hypothetical protein